MTMYSPTQAAGEKAGCVDREEDAVFLPAPVDGRRSVGASAVAESSTDVNLAVGDEPHRRRVYPDAAYPAALRLLPEMQDVECNAEAAAGLIYTVSTLSPQPVPVSLRAFMTRRGWRLAGVHTDADGSAHPSERPGLAAALKQLRSSAANVFVLGERAYTSMPDCLWLKIAVQCAGGVLCVAGDDPAAGGEAAAPDLEAVAAFVQVVRPVGLHREDQG